MSHTVAVSHPQPRRRPATRARRLSSFERGVLALLMLALFLTALLSTHDFGRTPPATQARRVEPGDTLWSLASTHPVQGLDTMRTAELIAELNGIEDSGLTAGSVVLLPVRSDDELAMR